MKNDRIHHYCFLPFHVFKRPLLNYYWISVFARFYFCLEGTYIKKVCWSDIKISQKRRNFLKILMNILLLANVRNGYQAGDIGQLHIEPLNRGFAPWNENYIKYRAAMLWGVRKQDGWHFRKFSSRSFCPRPRYKSRGWVKPCSNGKPDEKMMRPRPGDIISALIKPVVWRSVIWIFYKDDAERSLYFFSYLLFFSP